MTCIAKDAVCITAVKGPGLLQAVNIISQAAIYSYFRYYIPNLIVYDMRGNIFSPAALLSNAIALLLLVLAIKRPVTARTLISILFIGAACFNGYTAIAHPGVYLEFAAFAALPAYETFIRGPFSQHITAYILAIAIAQLLIGIGIAGRKALSGAALAGAIIFLIAIAPLGAGSAFPCSIVLAAACAVLLFKGQSETLRAIYSRRLSKRHPLA